jgi:hypothetical protein
MYEVKTENNVKTAAKYCLKQQDTGCYGQMIEKPILV